MFMRLSWMVHILCDFPVHSVVYQCHGYWNISKLPTRWISMVDRAAMNHEVAIYVCISYMYSIYVKHICIVDIYNIHLYIYIYTYIYIYIRQPVGSPGVCTTMLGAVNICLCFWEWVVSTACVCTHPPFWAPWSPTHSPGNSPALLGPHGRNSTLGELPWEQLPCSLLLAYCM